MTLSPGTRLGSYAILRKIGAGGMGDVYQAEDGNLGRHVAIKVLPRAFAEEAERLRRFQQEARAASALNHPNILTVHDLGTHEGAPFLVMELLEGGTLREKLGERGLPAKTIMEIGLQVAHGLAAAHEKGIVHRDLKPENVFITRDGRVKILDFGLAKLRAAEAGASLDSEMPTEAVLPIGMQTAAGALLGTVAYMSPEQAQGEAVDGRSDLFSFGVMLWEMLTGRRPFQRDSTVGTLQAIIHEEPPDLDSGLRVPPLLERVLRSCLAKNPEGRFHSAHDLAFALQAALEAGTGSSGGSAPARVSVNLSPLTRRSWLWAAASLALILAVGLFLWKPWRPAPRRLPSLVALPAKVLGAPESAFLAEAISNNLTGRLGSVEGLEAKQAPSAAQVERLKDDLGRIAEAYQVEHLVLSTVTAEGGKLILSVRLLEATTQKVRWAGQFQGSRDSYSGMIQEAAEGVVRALKPGGSVARSEFSSEIEIAIQEGNHFRRQYWRTKDPKDFERALGFYRKAQELAPSSAVLAARIADIFQNHYFANRDPKVKEESDHWVAKALELDPRCGPAWAVKCAMETNKAKADPATVIEYALKAARFAPNDSNSYRTLGFTSATNAMQAANGRRMIELDPLNPDGYSWAGLCLGQLGHRQEALDFLERAIRVQPRQGFHTWLKYYTLFHAERLDEARKTYNEYGWPDVSRLMRSLMDGDLEGGRALARKLAGEWRTQEMGAMHAANLAGFYGPLLVRLGLREEALWLLEKAADSNFGLSYDFLLVDPDFRTLQGEPRYAKALAVARKYAALWLELADRAKARGEFPAALEPALEDLRGLLNRNP